MAECITQPVGEYTATTGREFQLPVAHLPGNANLPIGDFRHANREIGVPGLSVAKLGCPAYAMIRFDI